MVIKYYLDILIRIVLPVGSLRKLAYPIVHILVILNLIEAAISKVSFGKVLVTISAIQCDMFVLVCFWGCRD